MMFSLIIRLSVLCLTASFAYGQIDAATLQALLQALNQNGTTVFTQQQVQGKKLI